MEAAKLREENARPRPGASWSSSKNKLSFWNNCPRLASMDEGMETKTNEAPINILIVDDHPENLAVIEGVLDDPGYRLLRATTAESALLTLLKEEFALLILEIRLPGMSGIELAQLIRERKKTERVPIIFLTAYYTEDQDRIEGYGAGAVDYLTKPVNPDILKSKVAVFADLHRKTRQIETANRALLAEVAVRCQAEATLLERTKDLEATNREMEALCTAFSHDLRSPLYAVNGFAEMLLHEVDDLPEAAREPLTHVAASGRRMGQLVQGLLEFARLGRRDLLKVPLDMDALVKGIIAELQRADPDRTVDVQVAPLPAANGDPVLIRQVLENLLGNAWKYTARQPHSVIEVGASQDGDETVFHVRDNGVGFDMAHASKLFEPFQRLHHQSEFPGVGIGLASAHRILRRHGGRLWATAQVDQGATFCFTLAS